MELGYGRLNLAHQVRKKSCSSATTYFLSTWKMRSVLQGNSEYDSSSGSGCVINSDESIIDYEDDNDGEGGDVSIEIRNGSSTASAEKQRGSTILMG